MDGDWLFIEGDPANGVLGYGRGRVQRFDRFRPVGAALRLERFKDLFMKVGGAGGDDIDDDDADTMLQVAGTFRGEGATAAGAVLVAGADELDRAAQLSAAQVLVNAYLVSVQSRE